MKSNRLWYSLLPATPLVAFLALFFYTPIVFLAYNAVYVRDEFKPLAFVSVVTNPSYLSVLLFSGEIALVTTICTLLITFPVALYVGLYSRGVERIALMVLLITPFWIDVLLRTWSLKSVLYLLGIREGYLAMVIGMVYDYMPFMFIPLVISLMRIPSNIIDAARTLGARPHHILIKVILPNSAPGIAVGCLLVFLMSYTEIVIPSLLGGVTGTTVGVLIYRLILEAGKWSDGAIMALLVTLLGLLVVVVTRKSTSRLEV